MERNLRRKRNDTHKRLPDMTVAELHFLESVPKTLKEIAESLERINTTLKEVEGKLSASSNLNSNQSDTRECYKNTSGENNNPV